MQGPDVAAHAKRGPVITAIAGKIQARLSLGALHCLATARVQHGALLFTRGPSRVERFACPGGSAQTVQKYCSAVCLLQQTFSGVFFVMVAFFKNIFLYFYHLLKFSCLIY